MEEVAYHDVRPALVRRDDAGVYAARHPELTKG